jgi:hypothetical protein
MRRPTLSILLLALALPAPALAYEDAPPLDPDRAVPDPAEASPTRPFAPPPIDYPGVQSPGPGISLYLDTTYETNSDLSTFWWVRGRGNNYRVAVGGTFEIAGLLLNAEVPVQYTQLAIDSLMNLPPTDADRRKSAVSLGDLITGAAHFWSLPIESLDAQAGLGVRVRWPTHTTRYQFGLVDGSILEFGFPYYFHVAPGAFLSASHGPVSVLLNQGVLAMLAKDVTIGDILQPIPNIYFWESHLVAGVDVTDWLLLSAELESFVQLNRVTVDNMTNLNDIRAVFVNPGLTLKFDAYRLALAGRFGVSGRSSRDFGVITFSGTHALLARVSYVF